MRKRPQEAHQLPTIRLGELTLIAGHGTVPRRDLPEDFAIRHRIHNFGVREICGLSQIKVCGAGRALPISIHSMAMRAMILVNVMSIRQSFRRGLDWILDLFRRFGDVPLAAARREYKACEASKTDD